MRLASSERRTLRRFMLSLPRNAESAVTTSR